MDSTGVAGLINVNQAEAQAVKKIVAREVEAAQKKTDAAGSAPSAAARVQMQTYTKIIMEGAEQGAPDAASVPNALDKTAYKLIGQHPLFPFDKNFMDVFKEFVKRTVSGEVEITNQTLAPVKEQIEQVKANIGTEKPAAVEETPKKTAPQDLSAVI